MLETTERVVIGTVTFGNCPHCNKGIINKHELPTIDAEIVESQYGYQTSEFGEPLCEWLPRVHYLVTLFARCPQCRKPIQKTLKVIDSKEEAEAFASKRD